MTNKEAIEILEDEMYMIWETASEKDFAMKRNEAFDMAIEALRHDVIFEQIKWEREANKRVQRQEESGAVSRPQDRAYGKERVMCEQMRMSILPPLSDDEDLKDLERQVELFAEYAKKKRKWENAFQKWSDEHGMHDGETSYGACGYGVMCDYCEDNSYGRPCVRALNKMCREKNLLIDYNNRDFRKVWLGE